MEERFGKKYRIAITGPESTGKTTLARDLAAHFNTFWVEEYSRAYLNNLGRPYVFEDIVEIAKGQLNQERKSLREVEKILFCDTDLLVTKIWSEVGFQKCDPWIIENIQTNPYDLYLLCKPDIPWEHDPLREHPTQRAYLFELYKQALEDYHFNYKIVHDVGEKRFYNSLTFIKELIAL